MIRAIGADLCEVERVARAIERTGERFLRRVFTDAERRDAEGARQAEELARRFAVKESTFKTLGRGWPNGVSFDEIELVTVPGGPSVVRLSGRAAALAESLGLARFVAATTDDGRLAAAVVVAEGP